MRLTLLLLLLLGAEARGQVGKQAAAERRARPGAVGREFDSSAPARDPRQCSLSRPVCVEGAASEVRRRAVRLLEDAYELVVLGQQGPAWPLDPRAEPMVWRLGSRPLTFDVELQLSLGFDRGRVTCSGGEITRATAIACAAGSSLSRSAPATSPALRQGFAGYLALLHDGGQATTEAIVQAAKRPEQGILSDVGAPTAALLVEHIAAKAEAGQAAAAPWLAFVLAATKTAPSSARTQAEPDLFDALASTFAKDDPHLARFLDEIAVLRFSARGPFGSVGAMPELAWEVDAESLPRNLVLPRPLLPTGSAYVLVRLDDVTRRNGLALRTFCEEGSRYAWSMVRLDADHRVLGRVQATGRDSGTSAEGVLRQLDSTQSALIVGTSLGGGPGLDLDPDETPLAPHSCEVVLDRLPGL